MRLIKHIESNDLAILSNVSNQRNNPIRSLSGDDSKQYYKRHKRIRDRFRGTHSDHFRLEAGVMNYY